MSQPKHPQHQTGLKEQRFIIRFLRYYLICHHSRKIESEGKRARERGMHVGVRIEKQ
jgi:hypothetical protein